VALKLFEKYSPAKLIALSSILSILLISGLSLFVRSTVSNVTTEQKEFATKIDIGGYQRMLSQRIVFYTYEYVKTRDNSDKSMALESNRLLLERHQILINEYKNNAADGPSSLLSETLKTLYFGALHDLDNALKEYVRISNSFLLDPGQVSQQDLNALKKDSQTILEKFDRVVQQYELESNERMQRLADLRGVIFVASAVLLFMLTVFVIRPLLLVSEALSERLKLEASKDHLTGLQNRRVFPTLAEQAIAMSRRSGEPLSIVLFDIDNFKKVNDQFGHDMGDKLLEAIAQTLVSYSRESDECFRFGGDEFVMLLPFTDAKGAFQVADNIRKHIMNLDGLASATVSAGVSCLLEEEKSIDQALMRADQSMYQAKSKNKNIVTVSQ
jgi:diguanylate cyclase (GGDEF)-like protein